jgi:adenine deaminase
MTREQLKEMPKGEFHLHMEGSLPYSLLREMNPKKYAHLPPFWKQNYRYASFADFDQTLLAMAGEWFTSVERYHTAAKAILDDAREQGVRYLEISIASGSLEVAGIDLYEVAAAIKSTVPADMTVRLFLGIHHGGYSSWQSNIDAGLDCPNLDGLDIHGDETDPLGKWALSLFAQARKKGKFTKCHAGEFMGPDFINRVVNELALTRLEHGVRAAESKETLALLAEKKVTLDICPVSNIKLQVAPSYEEHPLRTLVDAGISCTINRDDPLLFGSTLEEEYHLVQEQMKFNDTEILNLVKNGFDTALISDEKRKALYKELEEFAEKHKIT